MHSPLAFRATPVNASGRNLRKLLHGKPANVRAFVAAKLVNGEFQFVRPLPAQAARLCRVNPGRVNEALGRPPRRCSDQSIDKLIGRIGLDRIMAALDRATRPTIPSIPSASAANNDDEPADWWTEVMTAPATSAAT